ncbi:MAG: AbrB family transcriptional regulator [Bifidobacterium sp.]|nr:AbrB family transcriptional regulator [Bifidobacterium sp.]
MSASEESNQQIRSEGISRPVQQVTQQAKQQSQYQPEPEAARSLQTGSGGETEGVPEADGRAGDRTKDSTTDFEPLTDSYERLRHSTDRAELSEFARRPLPDKANQAAFSRATALLEAVAGNPNTPAEDRVFLAQTMPFPNVLVKLSQDPVPEVRKAVAGNADDKNWLAGRLTKDDDSQVRDVALRNKQTSWKMRLEGAQNPEVGAQTLDFLGKLGIEIEPDASPVLSAMVRREVALNPNCSEAMLRQLMQDPSQQVANAARGRMTA